MDMAEWLRGMGLEQYEPAFREHDIDGEILRRLTAEDLRDLGVVSIGHRRRLLDAIAALAQGPNESAAAEAAVLAVDREAEPPIGSDKPQAAEPARRHSKTRVRSDAPRRGETPLV